MSRMCTKGRDIWKIERPQLSGKGKSSICIKSDRSQANSIPIAETVRRRPQNFDLNIKENFLRINQFLSHQKR